jgi:hypothetical protein
VRAGLSSRNRYPDVSSPSGSRGGPRPGPYSSPL